MLFLLVHVYDWASASESNCECVCVCAKWKYDDDHKYIADHIKNRVSFRTQYCFYYKPRLKHSVCVPQIYVYDEQWAYC